MTLDIARAHAACVERDDLVVEAGKAAPDLAIFPNEAAITRLVGAILLEQNDEWAVQRARYMTRETMTEMLEPPAIQLPAVAA